MWISGIPLVKAGVPAAVMRALRCPGLSATTLMGDPGLFFSREYLSTWHFPEEPHSDSHFTESLRPT